MKKLKKPSIIAQEIDTKINNHFEDKLSSSITTSYPASYESNEIIVISKKTIKEISGRKVIRRGLYEPIIDNLRDIYDIKVEKNGDLEFTPKPFKTKL